MAEIDRLGHRFPDVEVQRLGNSQGLAAGGAIAATDDDNGRRAADRRKVAQHLGADMLAEREVERDAIERMSLHKRRRLLVAGGSRWHVAGLGRGSADDHAVQVIVVDDKKTLWRRRSIKAGLVRFR